MKLRAEIGEHLLDQIVLPRRYAAGEHQKSAGTARRSRAWRAGARPCARASKLWCTWPQMSAARRRGGAREGVRNPAALVRPTRSIQRLPIGTGWWCRPSSTWRSPAPASAASSRASSAALTRPCACPARSCRASRCARRPGRDGRRPRTARPRARCAWLADRHDCRGRRAPGVRGRQSCAGSAVAARVVLHQVARDEQRVGRPVARPCVREHGLQRRRVTTPRRVSCSPPYRCGSVKWVRRTTLMAAG